MPPTSSLERGSHQTCGWSRGSSSGCTSQCRRPYRSRPSGAVRTMVCESSSWRLPSATLSSRYLCISCSAVYTSRVSAATHRPPGPIPSSSQSPSSAAARAASSAASITAASPDEAAARRPSCAASRAGPKVSRRCLIRSRRATMPSKSAAEKSRPSESIPFAACSSSSMARSDSACCSASRDSTSTCPPHASASCRFCTSRLTATSLTSAGKSCSPSSPAASRCSASCSRSACRASSRSVRVSRLFSFSASSSRSSTPLRLAIASSTALAVCGESHAPSTSTRSRPSFCSGGSRL
mmetsp:Transcript_34222/g.109292  ORF Transcript_34222/g.109292 Transcript_34222/m.109292 type:complete len:296 (+) Transcript_34222:274-1161(+)